VKGVCALWERDFHPVTGRGPGIADGKIGNEPGQWVIFPYSWGSVLELLFQRINTGGCMGDGRKNAGTPPRRFSPGTSRGRKPRGNLLIPVKMEAAVFFSHLTVLHLTTAVLVRFLELDAVSL